MNTSNSGGAALVDLDKRSLLHPFTSIAEQQSGGSHVIAKGRGIYIQDTDGREYIDAMAGLWCVDIGYGREEIAEALAEQARRLPYYHAFMGMATEPAILLADRLASYAPGPLNKVFFGNSGSDANDTNIKILWQYNNLLGRPKKKKIIARMGGYHGVTVATAGLTGLPPMHKEFDVPLPFVVHVERPSHYWHAPAGMGEEAFSRHLAEKLEERILKEDPETIAAMIAEPIMGAGGVIVPPKGYFEAVVPVLRKYDILLISDEVVCGFGRLGQWFGCMHYGYQPDIITAAKGLTSGYVPMSASIISDAIWEVLRGASPQMGPFAHGYTYSAHPLAAACAMANLDIFEREQLLGKAGTTGAYMQRRLRESFAEHPLVGEVRGVGLIAGIELVADKAAKTAFDLAVGAARKLYACIRAEGLICRPIGNMLAFSPPLVITETEIDEVVARFSRGLERCAKQLRDEGVWKG